MKVFAAVLLVIAGVLLIMGIVTPGNQILGPGIDKLLWPSTIVSLVFSVAVLTGLGWRIFPAALGIVAALMALIAFLNPAAQIFGWQDSIFYIVLSAISFFWVNATRQRKNAAANP